MEQVVELVAKINCQRGEFSMKYRGLPLSNRELRKEHYKTMIDRVQNRLPGWQVSNLSVAGREVLVNVVLSSSLVYYMSTFVLPK
jgi:hypothetical protein